MPAAAGPLPPPQDPGTVYRYDYENRLIQFAYEYADGSLGALNTYAYDYRTRRVQRTEPTRGPINIAFDGGTSIMEFVPEGGGPLTLVEYIRGHDYGGGVGGLEYSVRLGGGGSGTFTRYNQYDSRGDVVVQTDASGDVAYQTAYKAFGQHAEHHGTTQDRQKASTKEEDPTGLLNEGFRYRDPQTGTFLTRDPLGFKAGINHYTYVLWCEEELIHHLHQEPLSPELLDTT